MWRHLSQTGSGCFLCQVLKLVLVKTDTPTHTPLLFLLFILFLFLDSLNTNLLIIKETHQKSSKCSSCRPQKCNSCLWRIHLMNALEIKWQTGAKKKKSLMRWVEDGWWLTNIENSCYYRCCMLAKQMQAMTNVAWEKILSITDYKVNCITVSWELFKSCSDICISVKVLGVSGCVAVNKEIKIRERELPRSVRHLSAST